MAKQCGPNYITGTIGGITFYQLNGEYLAKQKSSLEGKRVKNDPRFSNTMRNAHWFGEASTIKSEVFHYLLRLGPERLDNSKRIDRKMQSRAVTMVRSGMAKEEIKRVLLKEFEHYALPKENKKIRKKKNPVDNSFADKVVEEALKKESVLKIYLNKAVHIKKWLFAGPGKSIGIKT